MSVNLTGLLGGVPYRFDVRAYDAAGNRGGISTATFSPTNPITAAFTAGTAMDQQTGGSGTSVSAYYAMGADGSTSPVCGAPACAVSGGGAWISPASLPPDYQVMATNGCGTFASGTFGTWVSPGTQTVWSVYASDPSLSGISIVCSIGLQIRATANPGVILSSASISFSLWTGP